VRAGPAPPAGNGGAARLKKWQGGATDGVVEAVRTVRGPRVATVIAG
jgi:hypothetical protein